MSRRKTETFLDTGPVFNRDRGAPPPGKWYLSFDCATKSFAYALVRVTDADSLAPQVSRLQRAAGESSPGRVLDALRALAAASRAGFHLAGGGAADLVPGKKDGSIHTVERVRAVLAYLRGPVAAALAAAGTRGCPPPTSPDLNVIVEFQMGPNARARVVSTVLVAEFAAANVFFVGPACKNKLWYPSRPDLRHCMFIEKYRNLYTANKKHTEALYYDHIAPLFGHPDLGIPRGMKKDFADAVVQVLGFLSFGAVRNAAERF